jgi:hypothetical protein
MTTTLTMSAFELRSYQQWLTTRYNSSAFNTTVSPFAQRSQQYLKEQFGSADEKVRITVTGGWEQTC